MTERVDEALATVAAAMPAFVEVHIKFDVHKRAVVEVTGPMDNACLLFGILELAREAVYLDRAEKLKRRTFHVAGGPGILSG